MKATSIGIIFILAVIAVPAISFAVGLEPVTVPEPGTALLLAAGGFGLVHLARRKRN